MKKRKLEVEYEFDFDVFGITSTLHGYRLAWELNQRLGIHLVKQPDLLVGVKKNLEKGFMFYDFETPLNRLKVLKNQASDGATGKYYLIPEFPRFDFIILARLNELSMSEPLLETLRNIASVELVTPLNLEVLKSKSNFVF